MSCTYLNNSILDSDGGKCTLWDEAIEMNGCDKEGYCMVESDPDPSFSCGEYESDYSCSECGQDLNVEECDCEDQ